MEDGFRLLQEDYLRSLPDHVLEIENKILEIDNESFTRDRYTFILREVHSIKGSAGSFGLNGLSLICHKLEDRLVEMSDEKDWSKSIKIEGLLELVDIIKSKLEKKEINDNSLEKINDDIKKQLSKKTGGCKNVLIVDNSKVFSYQISNLLKTYDVSISYSKTGYEALGRVLHEKYDLIIASNNVVPLSGSDLFKILNKIESLGGKNIKKIIMSGQQEALDDPDLEIEYKILKNAKIVEKLTAVFKKELEAGKNIKKRIKFLFIDDDVNIHNIITYCFKKANKEADITSAQTAIDGIELLKNNKFDIVVLDYMLEEMTGADLLNKLEKEKLLNKTPVVFLSGKNRKKVESEIEKYKSARGVITKPINVKTFIDDLYGYIDGCSE